MIIPDNVEHLGERWFANSNIESVTIPASVKCIDTCAFYKCKNLKRITFAEGSQLAIIGRQCFYESGIEEFQSPQSLREIGDGAFSSCKSLESVILNEGLERLGKLQSEDNRYHGGVFENT